MRNYGTRQNPVRISSLPSLLKCTAMVYARLVQDEEHSSQAAIDGTAVGRAIELWHRGQSLEEAVRIAAEENPTALMDRVEKMFLGYANDPEIANLGCVVVEHMEQAVEFEYDGVWFRGHPDQVREKDGVRYVWDTKAGSYAGRQGGRYILGACALQIIGYAVALGCQPGGILRLCGYENKGQPGQIIFPAKFDWDWCYTLLSAAAAEVKRMRRGHYSFRPGDTCAYCEFGPAGECFQAVKQYGGGRCSVCRAATEPGRRTCSDACLRIAKGTRP